MSAIELNLKTSLMIYYETTLWNQYSVFSFYSRSLYITFQAISTVSAKRRQQHYINAWKTGSEEDDVSNLQAACADRLLYFQEA